ncbi:MAG: aliphatic sulfonate ABC transporter substrate-binding protein [Verrucomicrobia bacterium]|nr:MAG: aliphatic sulfonate ABC transporter substrate-binding protein [Verrucomicrobiota bacterium]
MKKPTSKFCGRTLLCMALAFLSTSLGFTEEVVRVGFFPNISHSQALVAANMSREGKGWFEKRLGTDIKIEWFVFNAGPSAMEAVFAKSIDLTYVGPSPAINAYLRSNGEEVRALSGAVRGGEALVVRNPDWKSAADLRGKIICTPQLGNTQDVACRAWLINQGLKVTLIGGDVRVIPMDNSSIFAQFSRGAIDGAWTVEPWVTRLLVEAKGDILYTPKDSIETILIARADFLKAKPDVARKFLMAHRELTDWIKAHPDEAQRRICDELSQRTRTKLSIDLIRRAWTRLRFDNAIELQSFEQFVRDARLTGLSRTHGDLSRFIEDPLKATNR